MPTLPRVTSVGDKALPSMTAALRRVGPGPSLDNTVELAGMMVVWVWQYSCSLQGCERLVTSTENHQNVCHPGYCLMFLSEDYEKAMDSGTCISEVATREPSLDMLDTHTDTSRKQAIKSSRTKILFRFYIEA
ncbi:hypothetical protein U0070_018684 [Myodes glareolus]|uniref:Uncharacterized protein n=1 Tax=Myodes glareolus TaxID=447135 RepID=A0AAW0IVV4_MYOGA